jgi:hypothetical protein
VSRSSAEKQGVLTRPGRRFLPEIPILRQAGFQAGDGETPAASQFDTLGKAAYYLSVPAIPALKGLNSPI